MGVLPRGSGRIPFLYGHCAPWFLPRAQSVLGTVSDDAVINRAGLQGPVSQVALKQSMEGLLETLGHEGIDDGVDGVCSRRCKGGRREGSYAGRKVGPRRRGLPPPLKQQGSHSRAKRTTTTAASCDLGR